MQYFIESILLPWLGGSLIITSIMLFCLEVGINVSERVRNATSAFAMAPLLIGFVAVGVALIARAAP